MKRIEVIRKMPVEEIAEIILKANITDEYCDGSCNKKECENEKECCIRWLQDETQIMFIT